MFPSQLFYDTQRLNPHWSSFICFGEVIENKKYLHRPTITKWFNKLVDKDDYSKNDKGEVLGFLFGLVKEREVIGD